MSRHGNARIDPGHRRRGTIPVFTYLPPKLVKLRAEYRKLVVEAQSGKVRTFAEMTPEEQAEMRRLYERGGKP